jgi:hypothetical protein
MTTLTTTLTSDTGSATERAVTGRGMTDGSVRTWLRLEGLAGLAAGLALYGWAGGSWLLLIPLLLVPDVSVIGYLAGNRVGAFAYNLVHTWAPGFVLFVVGTALDAPTLQLVAAILIAHVGMDRTAGYGLKLPSSFQDTHLGRMGRSRA